MLTPVDFRFICDFMRFEASIALAQGKEYFVESRLTEVAQRRALSGVGELVQQLRRSSEPALRQEVAEALTTNETSFFRDSNVFEVLSREVIPKLVAARRHQRHLRIWSAACSTGQEPYSLAMILREQAPLLFGPTWRLEILATDMNTQVLSVAEEGKYRRFEVQRGVNEERLERFFVPSGPNHYQVSDEIRQCIKFQQLNLGDAWRGLETMDLVLLRNVLIYFDNKTKTEILGRVASHMAADGCLVLGAMEMLIGMDVPFRTERVDGVAINHPEDQDQISGVRSRARTLSRKTG